MPAAIVAREGVQLVDDDGPGITEEHPRLGSARDEHDLDRLGRGEQQVGPFPQDGAPPGGAHVSVSPGLQFLRRRPPAARPFPVPAGRPVLVLFLLLKHLADGRPVSAVLSQPQ